MRDGFAVTVAALKPWPTLALPTSFAVLGITTARSGGLDVSPLRLAGGAWMRSVTVGVRGAEVVAAAMSLCWWKEEDVTSSALDFRRRNSSLTQFVLRLTFRSRAASDVVEPRVL